MTTPVPSTAPRPVPQLPLLPMARRGLRRLQAHRQRRMRERATEIALRGLDAATLRDIGIGRSEIESLPREAAGTIEATRLRLIVPPGL